MKGYKGILSLLVLYAFSTSPHAQKPELNKSDASKNTLAAADKYTDDEHYEKAAAIYRSYLFKNPKAKDVYIKYAEVERFLENYSQAMAILNAYYRLFGADDDYLKTKVRVFADAGYYNSALQLNTPLLQKNPDDSYLIATQASALNQSGRYTQALSELNHLKKTDPESDDISDLEEDIITPHKSSITLGSPETYLFENDNPMDFPIDEQYIHQNNNLNIVRVPVLAQTYLNPNLRLLFLSQYEHLSAPIGSGLETINGKSTIYDIEYFLGAQTSITPDISLRGMIGSLAIGNGTENFVYNLTGKLLVTEKFQLYLQGLRELFRPPLISNDSPRSVSLGILEDGGRVHATLIPTMQSSIDLDLSASKLTDSNSYVSFYAEPEVVFYNSDKLNLTLGLELQLQSFSKQLFINGYYSPKLYQLYEFTSFLDIKVKENLKIEHLWGSWCDTG